jgi:hypothetical protein
MLYINMLKKIVSECKNRDTCRKCPLFVYDDIQHKARCIFKSTARPEGLLSNITILKKY